MYDGLSADDILTFSGAEEGIFLVMHALLEPDDHVVAVMPAYQSLYEVARFLEAEVTPVPLRPEENWKLDVDSLTSCIRPTTRLVVINFPHNPTGAHIDRRQLDEIIRVCRHRGIVLLSDEVYRFLEHRPEELLPPAASLYERAISLGVMSKSFALAGLRIGWIATQDRGIRARIAIHKDYTTLCGSAPSEVLALIALRARDRVLDRSRAIIRQNLPILGAFMERHAAHLSWVAPRAGSICFPRFRADVDAERAAELLIEKAGVVVVPGSAFDFDRAHFRVGYGREDMAEGLDLIDPLIPLSSRE
jgi:aspartate/methionine/tyrosine aminotransferase